MGRMEKYKDEEMAKLAVNLVAYAMQIPSHEILETRRGSAKAALGRHIAMYVVYVGFGISLARVAIAFDRDRSTVAYACHQMEDRRDDPEFDHWLDELEKILRQAAGLSATPSVAA